MFSFKKKCLYSLILFILCVFLSSCPGATEERNVKATTANRPNGYKLSLNERTIINFTLSNAKKNDVFYLAITNPTLFSIVKINDKDITDNDYHYGDDGEVYVKYVLPASITYLDVSVKGNISLTNQTADLILTYGKADSNNLISMAILVTADEFVIQSVIPQYSMTVQTKGKSITFNVSNPRQGKKIYMKFENYDGTDDNTHIDFVSVNNDSNRNFKKLNGGKSCSYELNEFTDKEKLDIKVNAVKIHDDPSKPSRLVIYDEDRRFASTYVLVAQSMIPQPLYEKYDLNYEEEKDIEFELINPSGRITFSLSNDYDNRIRIAKINDKPVINNAIYDVEGSPQYVKVTLYNSGVSSGSLVLKALTNENVETSVEINLTRCYNVVYYKFDIDTSKYVVYREDVIDYYGAVPLVTSDPEILKTLRKELTFTYNDKEYEFEDWTITRQPIDEEIDASSIINKKEVYGSFKSHNVIQHYNIFALYRGKQVSVQFYTLKTEMVTVVEEDNREYTKLEISPSKSVEMDSGITFTQVQENFGFEDDEYLKPFNYKAKDQTVTKYYFMGWTLDNSNHIIESTKEIRIKDNNPIYLSNTIVEEDDILRGDANGEANFYPVYSSITDYNEIRFVVYDGTQWVSLLYDGIQWLPSSQISNTEGWKDHIRITKNSSLESIENMYKGWLSTEDASIFTNDDVLYVFNGWINNNAITLKNNADEFDEIQALNPSTFYFNEDMTLYATYIRKPIKITYYHYEKDDNVWVSNEYITSYGFNFENDVLPNLNIPADIRYNEGSDNEEWFIFNFFSTKKIAVRSEIGARPLIGRLTEDMTLYAAYWHKFMVTFHMRIRDGAAWDVPVTRIKYKEPFNWDFNGDGENDDMGSVFDSSGSEYYFNGWITSNRYDELPYTGEEYLDTDFTVTEVLDVYAVYISKEVKMKFWYYYDKDLLNPDTTVYAWREREVAIPHGSSLQALCDQYKNDWTPRFVHSDGKTYEFDRWASSSTVPESPLWDGGNNYGMNYRIMGDFGYNENIYAKYKLSKHLVTYMSYNVTSSSYEMFIQYEIKSGTSASTTTVTKPNNRVPGEILYESKKYIFNVWVITMPSSPIAESSAYTGLILSDTITLYATYKIKKITVTYKYYHPDSKQWVIESNKQTFNYGDDFTPNFVPTPVLETSSANAFLYLSTEKWTDATQNGLPSSTTSAIALTSKIDDEFGGADHIVYAIYDKIDNYSIRFYCENEPIELVYINGTEPANGPWQYLEYMSFDSETNRYVWTQWSGSAKITSLEIGDYNAIYMRGKNNSVITDGGKFVFSGLNDDATSNEKIRVDGKLSTLLGGGTMESNCFDNMFRGQTRIVSTPIFDVLTLSDGCYKNMFYGCTGLSTVPALPKVTLTPYCYQSMFEKCSGLKQIEGIDNCTSASNAFLPVPDKDKCYDKMFYDTADFQTCFSASDDISPNKKFVIAFNSQSDADDYGKNATSFTNAISSGFGLSRRYVYFEKK